MVHVRGRPARPGQGERAQLPQGQPRSRQRDREEDPGEAGRRRAAGRGDGRARGGRGGCSGPRRGPGQVRARTCLQGQVGQGCHGQELARPVPYAKRRRTEMPGDSSDPSRAGQELSPQDPAERARAICLRLLTGTPRTRKQLADALAKREIPEDVAQEVLSRFEDVGLIDDAAFADAWVESRHHGRGLARRALARELRTKGVDPTLIDEAVGQLDSDQEEATARELVARKLRATRGMERDRRLRRLAGMLARKGYPEGMALRVVRQALEEEGEDTEGLDESLY
ncbi:recombination regulator RecX [Streptomyces scopuliridis]|uniref:recombination regulator RecX n=1 Tax=Streptomyces scopuliridis TaxID=452529 RepID=UPI0036B57BBE